MTEDFPTSVINLSSVMAACPWCGETLEWVIDPVNTAAYVEDCYVCCRPCLIQPLFDDAGVVVEATVDCE